MPEVPTQELETVGVSPKVPTQAIITVIAAVIAYVGGLPPEIAGGIGTVCGIGAGVLAKPGVVRPKVPS